MQGSLELTNDYKPVQFKDQVWSQLHKKTAIVGNTDQFRLKNSENLPKPILEKIYTQTRQELESLEDKNNLYDRDTIKSGESIKKDKYNEYKEKMRAEFLKEKQILKDQLGGKADGGLNTRIQQQELQGSGDGRFQESQKLFGQIGFENVPDNKTQTMNSDLQYFQQTNRQEQKGDILGRRKGQLEFDFQSKTLDSDLQDKKYNLANEQSIFRKDSNEQRILYGDKYDFDQDHSHGSDLGQPWKHKNKTDYMLFNKESMRQLNEEPVPEAVQKVSYSNSTPNLLGAQGGLGNRLGSTVSVRDELRQRKLEMIEERESEHDRAKLLSDEKDANLTTRNYEIKSPKEKSSQQSATLMRQQIENRDYIRLKTKNPREAPSKSFGAQKETLPTLQNLVEFGQKKFLTKNGQDFSDILDESSNLAIPLSKDDSSLLLRNKNHHAREQAINLQNLDISRIQHKCERLEKENSVLIQNNQDLRGQIKKLTTELELIQKSSFCSEKAEFTKMRAENQRLEELLLQLQNKYTSSKVLAPQTNSKANGSYIHLTDSYQDNPFRTIDGHYSLEKSGEVAEARVKHMSYSVNPDKKHQKDPHRKLHRIETGYGTERIGYAQKEIFADRESSKKLKFAESVVSMLANLVEGDFDDEKDTSYTKVQTDQNRSFDLKKTWQILKKIVKDYFDMKRANQIANYENQNLPTAVKGDMREIYMNPRIRLIDSSGQKGLGLFGNRSERIYLDKGDNTRMTKNFSSHSNLRNLGSNN